MWAGRRKYDGGDARTGKTSQHDGRDVDAFSAFERQGPLCGEAANVLAVLLVVNECRELERRRRGVGTKVASGSGKNVETRGVDVFDKR